MRWTCAAPIPQTDATHVGISLAIRVVSQSATCAGSGGNQPRHADAGFALDDAIVRSLGPRIRAPFLPWNADSWKRLFVCGAKSRSRHYAKDFRGRFLSRRVDYLRNPQHERAGDRLMLHLWKQNAADRWGWIALLGSLIVGFALRIARLCPSPAGGAGLVPAQPVGGGTLAHALGDVGGRLFYGNVHRVLVSPAVSRTDATTAG